VWAQFELRLRAAGKGEELIKIARDGFWCGAVAHARTGAIGIETGRVDMILHAHQEIEAHAYNAALGLGVTASDMERAGVEIAEQEAEVFVPVGTINMEPS
jgi:hypothetical protein